MKRKKLPAPPLSTIELPGLNSEKVRSYRAAFEGMNRLHGLSTRLLEATGLGELLEEILEATIALQRADFGNVQLYNRQTETLEIVAQRGFGPEFLDYFRSVPPGMGACGLALRRRQRVIIEDTEADSAYAPCRAAAAAAGYRAVQSTPMFSRDGELLGMLSTHFWQPHRPSEWNLRLTDLYVQQAAGLIERKQAEEALRASEARYRALVHATSAAVWRLNPDGKRQLSLEGDIFQGHGEPELQSGDWLSRIHPGDRARTHEAWRRAVSTQSLYEIEHRVMAADGGYRCLLTRGVPVRDAAGEVLEWIGASADITERKEAEVALREREAQLAFAQRVGRVGVWGRDLASGVSFVTEAWCDIVGIKDPTSVRSFPEFLALVHPEDRARVAAADRQTIETGSEMDLELRILHPERGERWMLARARCLPAADGKGQRLLGVIIDITEQKRTEEAWRASEERLRFAAQAAGFGIYELNLATGQAYRSPEYKALFGLRPNDEFELDADQVPIYVHPDDRALVRNVTRESRDPRGSGTKDVEYRVVLSDGAVRWLLVRGRTFFEGEGKARRPVGSRGIALDVTERKQLEREILEISGREQRRISQDLHDGLCQQLAGIEFRNSVLVQQLAQDQKAKAEAVGIGELIRDVNRQARLLARGLSPVSLETNGLMSALEELTSNVSKLFNISCRFECPRPVLLADNTVATHLYRIVQEAISNAVKHGQAKFIIVSLSCSGGQLTLRIWNNGAEFPADASAQGGLGLRIMQYRGEMIGATLKISSAIGKGTTIECTFKMN